MFLSLIRLEIRPFSLFVEGRLGRLYHPSREINLDQHLEYPSLTKKNLKAVTLADTHDIVSSCLVNIYFSC